MKQINGIDITTYDVGNGFRVDIIDDHEVDYFQAQIYRRNFSKMAMSAFSKAMATIDQYTKKIEDELDEYKEMYDNDFMKGYRYDGLPEEVELANEITTDTYRLDDEWMVDIIVNDEEDTFEAWLYRADMGVKSLMFGWPKTQPDGMETDYKGFLGMVLGQWEEYAEGYDEDFQ